MERKPISAKVHPKVVEEMECVRLMFKFKGWGGVIEQMAKMIWPTKLDNIQAGKYERDDKEEK